LRTFYQHVERVDDAISSLSLLGLSPRMTCAFTTSSAWARVSRPATSDVDRQSSAQNAFIGFHPRLPPFAQECEQVFRSSVGRTVVVSSTPFFASPANQAKLVWFNNTISAVLPKFRVVVSCPKCALFQAPILECILSPTFCTASSAVHLQLLPDICS
jgi:hypothetical protein